MNTNFVLFSLVVVATVGAAEQDNLRVNIQQESRHSYSTPVTVSPYSNGSIQPDGMIIQRTQALIQDRYSRYVIDIHVSEGVVTLKGAVSNPSDLQNIERDVQSVPGVQQVRNLLVVSPAG